MPSFAEIVGVTYWLLLRMGGVGASRKSALGAGLWGFGLMGAGVSNARGSGLYVDKQARGLGDTGLAI